MRAQTEIKEPNVREPAAESETLLKLPDLLKFYVTGIKPSPEAPLELPEHLTPALLYADPHLSRARYDYPLCLADEPADDWAIPLKTIFDNLIAENAPAGDEGDLFKKTLLALETMIKALLEKKGGGRLSELWDAAAKNLLEEARAKNQKDEVIEAQLASVREARAIDGLLIPCNPEAPRRLLQEAQALVWQEKTGKFGEEINNLVSRLKNFLSTAETKSPRAFSAKKLQASLGKDDDDELDFQAFSDILALGESPDALPEKRRKRVADSLKTLETWNGHFLAGPRAVSGKIPNGGNNQPTGEEAGSAQKTLEILKKQSAELGAFFKALRIARLELANRYQEEKHDQFFEEFSLDYLSSEELNLFPPVMLSLSSDGLSAEDKSLLIDLLSSGLPVKILLRIDDLFEWKNDSGALPRPNHWAAQLARMALNLGNTFVLQASSANVSALADGFQKGMRHPGAALFAVYTGQNPEGASHLPAYVLSAAAPESRIFPAFMFNPAAGDNWAGRFSIAATSQFQQTWPLTDFAYQASDGQEKTVALNFTGADFLAADPRFASQFMPLPHSFPGENLLPLNEYLELAAAENIKKIPYILMVDEQGLLRRVMMTRLIVSAVRKIAADWRSLQELGGVGTSLSLPDAEKERLAEEMRRQVKEIEEKYQAEKSRTPDDLARQIVSNIVAGLLNESMPGGAPVMPAVSAPPKTAQPAPQEAPAAPAEKEKEAAIIEEPYIDTPLCTSCNDCININNRLFGYNENKQAVIKDPAAGTFRDLVLAAEKCPVRIIHPGKPKNPAEAGLPALIKRAEKYN